MSTDIPTVIRALVVQASKEQRNPPIYDAAITEQPLRKPKSGEVMVKLLAAGFNRKDVSWPYA